MRTIMPPDEGSYSYAGTGYANPDAVSQIANGLSTTTYSYDNNGNLSQKTTDGVTTTYVWDYANRLVALGSGGATTTYGYDAFGSPLDLNGGSVGIRGAGKDHGDAGPCPRHVLTGGLVRLH